MKISRFPAVFVLLLLSTNLFSQANEKWTLEKCIEYAFAHNIQVRQTDVTQQISKNENLQSKLNFLPSVDGNITFSNNFGNGFNPQTYSFAQGTSQSLQTSVQATLPLFTGLQQVFNVERTKYELLASKFDYENAKQNVALSVASAYLQVLLNKEILKVAEKQKQLTTQQLETVKAKIKSGTLPEVSLFETDAQLARDEANIVAAQNAIDLGLLSLKQLLQLNEKNFEVAVPEVPLDNVADVAALSSESIFQYALGNQPSIKSAEARWKSANASHKATLGALSPTISAFGSLSSSYFSGDRKYGPSYDSIRFPFSGDISGIPFTGTASLLNVSSTDLGAKTFAESLTDNFRKVVGINVSIPIFSRWQRVTNIQNAKLQMQIRELQLESNKNQLRQDIEVAYTNAKAAAQSFVANKKSTESAQKSLNAFDKRFGAGMLGNFELQQAKNSLAVAESEMIRAKYTYVFRLKVLDFYQGKPLRMEN